MEDNGTVFNQPQTVAEFEALLKEATSLKKDLRMVTKITNSEKLIKLSDRLDALLPVLPGVILDLKARGRESKGEERKRFAHMGVQFQSLDKDLKGKESDIAAGLVTLSEDETSFLGLDSEPESGTDDNPDAKGEEGSTEDSESEQKEDESEADSESKVPGS